MPYVKALDPVEHDVVFYADSMSGLQAMENEDAHTHTHHVSASAGCQAIVAIRVMR